jgi:hypothetical protein
MVRASTIAVLLSALVLGCGRQQGEMVAPQAAGPKRILLVVPPEYKIVNETETLLILRADHIRITFFKIDDHELEILKKSRSQMAASPCSKVLR